MSNIRPLRFRDTASAVLFLAFLGCAGTGTIFPSAPGLTFVAKGAPLPTAGQFVREENLTAPYRVIRPVDRTSQERSFDLLNVELDAYSRVIGLACG